MADPRDVVITGLGVVSPIGIGRDAFWHSVCNQQSGVRVREQFRETDWCYRIAAEVQDFDPRQFVKPRKNLKLMCREIQLAFAAAALAMEDARLQPDQCDPDRLGVVLGSELFYCQPAELVAAYQKCLADGQFDYDRWGSEAMGQIYPLWMLKHLPNMPACHIGIAFDARGPNNTIVSEECSSLNAVIEAARMIERGQADVMLTGGTGGRCNLTTMIYRTDLDLTRAVADPAAACRPFEASRGGMVVGEGAGVVVLESRAHARRRGAEVLAQVAGYAQGFGRGSDERHRAAIATTITSALSAAHLAANQIGHVNANGLSTVRDDETEAQAIHDAVGDIPVTAPKSFFGNIGAGSGAVEMMVSLLALRTGEVPVTLNYERPDPRCPVRVVSGQPLQAASPTALVVNDSRLGQATAVALTEA